MLLGAICQEQFCLFEIAYYRKRGVSIWKYAAVDQVNGLLRNYGLICPQQQMHKARQGFRSRRSVERDLVIIQKYDLRKMACEKCRQDP